MPTRINLSKRLKNPRQANTNSYFKEARLGRLAQHPASSVALTDDIAPTYLKEGDNMSTYSLADQVLPKKLKMDLARILEHHNRRRASKGSGKGVVSMATRTQRSQVIHLAFAQLWQAGYRVQSPRSIGDKHIKFLVDKWDKEGLSNKTLHTRISYMNTFCGWIGKPGLVKRPADYLPAERVKRTHIAQEDKSWEGKGLDVEEEIEKAKTIDERFAAFLSLQHHLGLRVKESLEFRPEVSLQDDGKTLEIFEGTKGGRRRTVIIETPEQRAAFENALRLARKNQSGRMRWPGLTYKQARRKFYDLVERKLGITRKDVGATPHGLRHGFSHRHYQRRTGFPTPIEGGALGKITPEEHRMATLSVSKVMGHVRPSVCASYCGSYGHQLRIYKQAELVIKTGAFNLRHEPQPQHKSGAG